MNATRIIARFHREAERLGSKDQPDYGGGYVKAMESIVAASMPRSADPLFVRALQMECFTTIGIAMPAPVYGRNKRGKEIVLRLRESATAEQLLAIKAEIARKEMRRNRPSAIVIPYGVVAPVLMRGGNLTKEELARRAAVIAQAA